ncbi:MAG: KOW domain-containing RNA-binding protein [Clostridia bacterium]|nr:KOW domain-containing RNA-binding protein [Clostridia bacterium]MBQ7091482.1 KOW domain-containing RNA-binding protein [Clostridia bacterium]
MRSEVEGRIVTALSGRDRGRTFVVAAAEPEGFVMLVDGETRRFARPKKKKLKHVEFHEERLDLTQLPNDKACADAFIRKALIQRGYNKKTVSEEG